MKKIRYILEVHIIIPFHSNTGIELRCYHYPLLLQDATIMLLCSKEEKAFVIENA